MQRWHEAETSQRYIDLYGTGQNDNFKRQKFAEGGSACYEELFSGMRSGLNANWLNNSIFVGYLNGWSWECLGRWSGWENYSLHCNNQITWEQNVWDGGSINYYMSASGTLNSDFNVCSMQVAAQNRVFMLEDQLSDNPDF